MHDGLFMEKGLRGERCWLFPSVLAGVCFYMS